MLSDLAHGLLISCTMLWALHELAQGIGGYLYLDWRKCLQYNVLPLARAAILVTLAVM